MGNPVILTGAIDLSVGSSNGVVIVRQTIVTGDNRNHRCRAAVGIVTGAVWTDQRLYHRLSENSAIRRNAWLLSVAPDAIHYALRGV